MAPMVPEPVRAGIPGLIKPVCLLLAQVIRFTVGNYAVGIVQDVALLTLICVGPWSILDMLLDIRHGVAGAELWAGVPRRESAPSGAGPSQGADGAVLFRGLALYGGPDPAMGHAQG